ncbi:MAG TPA: alpha-2-macroglobulin family protein, partial [Anaerolineaceae bacterium]|nr:alpha-2-macroglobulin family protein [Anaerolineaceae bacterium]
PVGGGGGGGDQAPVPQIRTDFQDTAFWSATLTTGEDGTATAEVLLPDNLTTWVALARGLDAESRVGEAETEVTVSKPLLIRPSVPRYFVAGDHVRLAAIAHNNTAEALTAQISLQATGFSLQDGAAAQQTVKIPAGRWQVVYWPGQVGDGDGVDLVFQAQAGDLSDAATPEGGQLPVLRYTAPQTFTTTGILAEGGEELEIVSLPRSFDPDAGRLQVELSTTLAGAVVAGLEALEAYPYDYTEPVISHLLPNLQVKLALQRLEVADPELLAGLNQAIEPNLEWLHQHQNNDGGWGWAPNRPSDTYLSAYALLALARAQQAGELVDAAVVSAAQNYLLATLISPEMAAEEWQLNRLAFVHFALSESGLTSVPPTALYPFQDRLSPWAKAFLAISLAAGESGSEPVQTLLSELQATAVRSSGGVHWDSDPADWANYANPLFSTSAVTYALSKADPASPLLADAVRYLVAHYRIRGVGSSYGTAWALLALTEYMEGTGELQAVYDFSARLNDSEIVSGQASGLSALEPAQAEVPIGELNAEAANGLVISRTDGPGRLYYRADLQVSRPVETIPALERGLTIEREYFLASEDCRPGECTLVSRVSLSGANPVVLVRLTLTLPSDMHYLMVEDVAPAGAEIVDPALDVFQTFEENVPQIDDRDPFGSGWGWWFFSDPVIQSGRATWLAESVPAGTYQLVYRLLPQQVGEFHALPARAWQAYFPEVQGTSSGAILTIEE